jgi:hypothetical protein
MNTNVLEDPEVGGSMFPKNVGIHLQDYRAPQPKTPYLNANPLENLNSNTALTDTLSPKQVHFLPVAMIPKLTEIFHFSSPDGIQFPETLNRSHFKI